MLRNLWKTSGPLTATGLLMLPVLAVALYGLAVDARMITGAPAWLKPAKFAVSISIYTLTLAWIFTLIPQWSRTRTIVGWTTAVTLVLEIAIITAQAYRGVASHFNVSTPLDAVLFSIMGAAILVQTLSVIAVAVAVWREQLPDRALTWALRMATVMTIAGGLTGGLMTRPTEQQLAGARAGERMLVVGAHTVGGPDGGPGLPGTGWSTRHGDIRVAHFIGLHALQVLPIIALLLARRSMAEVVRVRLILVSAGSYAGLFSILLWQALRGQSVYAPDGSTLVIFGVWAFITTAAAAASVARVPLSQRPAIV
jgi:hypothetical protein